MKWYVTSLAAFPQFPISTHFIYFVNLAANPSDWPVLGNQMVRNAQGSLSHKTSGLVCHRHVPEFGSSSTAELRGRVTAAASASFGAPWRPRQPQLRSCLPAVRAVGVALRGRRDPSLLLSNGTTGRTGGLCGLLLDHGSSQGIRDSPEPSSSCTCCCHWWWRWTRTFTGQRHKKSSGVEHSSWVFYKKLIIDFIAECQIHFSPSSGSHSINFMFWGRAKLP